MSDILSLLALTDALNSPQRNRTQLDPREEEEFLRWYRRIALRTGIHPNPDLPEHRYDYRGAFRAGAQPRIDPSDNRFHWPSAFKDPDHPRRFLQGLDTITGFPK